MIKSGLDVCSVESCHRISSTGAFVLGRLTTYMIRKESHMMHSHKNHQVLLNYHERLAKVVFNTSQAASLKVGDFLQFVCPTTNTALQRNLTSYEERPGLTPSMAWVRWRRGFLGLRSSFSAKDTATLRQRASSSSAHGALNAALPHCRSNSHEMHAL